MFCIPVDVVDNFLDKQYFQNLQNVMFGKEFTWFYIDGIDYPGEEGEKFQFTHTFYDNRSPWNGIGSPWYNIVEPFIIKLGATWCGPCKKIEPLVNDWLQKMPINVCKCIKINTCSLNIQHIICF